MLHYEKPKNLEFKPSTFFLYMKNTKSKLLNRETFTNYKFTNKIQQFNSFVNHMFNTLILFAVNTISAAKHILAFLNYPITIL